VPDHRTTRLSDAPDLVEQVHALHREAWPVFLRAGHHAGERHWHRLFSDFARYQFVLRDGAGGVVAAGHALPLALDDPAADLPAGWEAALEQGVADRAAGRPPTALCALAIVVAGTHRGRGLSADALRAMRVIAAEHGLPVLIAPVRPTRKEL
jgi:hypothetical protein